MKIYLPIERKLTYWKSAFESISNKQNQETEILKDLITELQHVRKEEFVTVCS